MTPVIRLLLFANIAVFALQEFTGDWLLIHFALWPLGSHFIPGAGRVGFEPWQLITSAFLHGGLAHIALNMYARIGLAPVCAAVLRLRAHG